jgi:hypothetical protein
MIWLRRLFIVIVVLILGFFLVVLPVGGSFLITNSRFPYREKGPQRPEDVGLPVEDVEFKTGDGITLRGWWTAGEEHSPVIIFLHGLNRSRLELLERAGEAHKRGYGVLMFDFRNHGKSDPAYTTIGILEVRDVKAASAFVNMKAPGHAQLLWGVSMGAATALLAVRDFGGFAGVVSDSAFPSFRETIEHHVKLLFHIPSFPVANMIVWITGMRASIDPDSGDVEQAVRAFGNVPVLFIAGGKDRRMPPGVAKRLYDANQSPKKKLFVVDGAGHGEAFNTDRERYLEAVFGFMDSLEKK